MTKERFESVISYLRDLINGSSFEGHVFAVGGCVRDLLMEREIKDIDLVIDQYMGGISFANWIYSNGLCTHDVVSYETYGTAMFSLTEFPDIELECVHTRKEQYHDKESRNPVTEYGTLLEDCMRRDLTVNALYYNISTREITDPTGRGIQDIKNRLLRVTSNPDIVYDDDPLRILRAIRFCCTLSTRDCLWTIEPETYSGIVKFTDRLSIISKERIQAELDKIMMSERPVDGLLMLKETGVMKYVIPELIETYEMEQNAYHFGTVWQHTLKVVGNIAADRNVSCLITEWKLPVMLAGLLHDIGKIRTFSRGDDGRVHFYQHEVEGERMCRSILKRLKYSNDIIEKVAFLTKNHMLTKNWGDSVLTVKDKSIRKLQYMCRTLERFDALLCVIDADNKAHAENHCLPEQVGNIRTETKRMVSECTHMFGYELPIDGDDVMFHKHIGPGPLVKRYLDHSLKLALKNPLLDREAFIEDLKMTRINEKKKKERTDD